MSVFILRRLFTVPSARVVEHSETAATLQIDGLVCSICANRVSASLRALDGVAGAECSLDSGIATVTLTGRPPAPQTLARAVESAAILTPVRRLLAAIARSARR